MTASTRVPQLAPTLALTLALAAGQAAPAPAVPAAPAADKPAIDLAALEVAYEKIVLPNGLTVLVHEDHAVPIVAVNLWYHVGSGSERPGKTGFAHLFEHFFFNGSENYPHGFREAMDDLGANNRNGTTNTDRTNFFEDVPVSALERTLYLEADRMGFLANYISQEMLERERGVVSNEKRQGENQPYGRVFSRMVEAIYPAAHPYSWSTIGRFEDLEAATIDDVREWYRTYYGPTNCVLSLAGDITPERARELVEKYFGAIPPGPALPRYDAWMPPLERDLRDTMEDAVPQARIYRVWRIPGWGSEALARMELVGQVLSGSRSGRLDRRLVYEKQLVTAISAGAWDKEIASDFLVDATVKEGIDPAAVEAEIDAVIADLVASGPSAEELARAKTRILSGRARGLERLGGFGGRSDILAESQTFGGDPHAYLDYLKKIDGATPADVQAAAREWMRQSHYTMTVVPQAKLAATPSDLDRSILPAIGEAADPRFPAIQRATLSNGLDVMLLERHSAPLVNMTLAVDAGFASDPRPKAGMASLALELLDDGTATRDNFAIEDDLDALGASISTATTLDLSLVRLRALSGSLAGALDIYADVVLRPSFPADLVALEKRRRIARIGQEKAQPVAAAQRLVPEILYGAEHPYGKPLTGSGFVASVEAVDRGDLEGWHATWFRPGSATLVVAGDVTLDALVPQLEKAFGGWASGRAPEKKVDAAGTGARGKVYLIDKPDAPQSVIVATHLTVAGGQSDDLAIETLLRNFGGMATSRLNRNLRLDKHWSYGTFGGIADARGAQPFLVIAPVQSDKTKEAIDEVAQEIRGVAGERPVVGEEFASILRNVTLRLPGRFETLAALEGAALDIVRFGYPESYFADYGSRARALSEEDLARAGSEVVHPDELVWLVVGDLAKVESGIRELDLGEIVHLDADGKVAD